MEAIECLVRKRKGDGDMSVNSIKSGEGGVGKTTVSVKLAICLGSRGNRVLVLDWD